MKKIKKVSSVVLAVIIILLNIVPTFAIESPDDLLLKYGYSQSFLDSVSPEMITNMLDKINYNEEITNIYSKTVYLYENNIQTRGAIPESSLPLEITAAEICKKDTNIITRVLVAISWDWAGVKPFQRWQDAITVNWDANLFVFSEDSFLSQDYAKGNEEDEWIIEREYTRASHHAQGGLGFYTQLSASLLRTAGAAIFLLEPKKSMIMGSDEITEINVNYVHDRKFLVPLNIGFTTVGFNVSFNISGNAYDEAADSVNFEYSLGG